jgi:Tol biopolymer transport system component
MILNDITRINTDALGNQSNGYSGTPGWSADGRYIIFESEASNLVSGDTNGVRDIFIKDLTTGAVQRVSTSGSGVQANKESGNGSLSSNGQYAVFVSAATNLTSGDSNGVADIFIKDLQSGAVRRIASGASGASTTSPVFSPPVFSPDSRYVAFSSASEFQGVPSANGARNVYTLDLLTGAAQRVSATATGQPSEFGSGDYGRIAYSPDGRYVTFTGDRSLSPGEKLYSSPLYMKDLQTGALQRISVDLSKFGIASSVRLDSITNAEFSPDGHYLAFTCGTSYLIEAFPVILGTVYEHHIFVKDLQTGAIQLASTDSSGKIGHGQSFGNAEFSPDGRYLAFSSDAYNLVSGDTNRELDIFVKDLFTGAIETITVNNVRANKGGALPSFSPDGQYIVFQSRSTNLVDGDTNGSTDIFVMKNPLGNSVVTTLGGTEHDDVFSGTNSNDIIDGGAGTDSVVYSGNRSNYVITQATGGFKVTDLTGTNGIDTVANIERLRFVDKSVALDGVAASAYRLYQAAFDRKPDLPGLGYWIAQRDNGLSLYDAAWNFINSAEFKTLYGANVSNSTFISAIYGNVLHRAPDQKGFDYWLDMLSSNKVSRHGMLAEFSESPENVAQVVGSIQNGIEYTPFLA